MRIRLTLARRRHRMEQIWPASITFQAARTRLNSVQVCAYRTHRHFRPKSPAWRPVLLKHLHELILCGANATDLMQHNWMRCKFRGNFVVASNFASSARAVWPDWFVPLFVRPATGVEDDPSI